MFVHRSHSPVVVGHKGDRPSPANVTTRPFDMSPPGRWLATVEQDDTDPRGPWPHAAIRIDAGVGGAGPAGETRLGGRAAGAQWGGEKTTFVRAVATLLRPDAAPADAGAAGDRAGMKQ